MLGEQLLIKMWDTLFKEGIGSLLTPWQIKREGKANAEVRCAEMLMIAQTEKDIQKIKEDRMQLLIDSKFINKNITKIGSEDNNKRMLIENMQKSFKSNILNSMQQEINLSKIINIAEQEILSNKSEETVSESTVENDWILRWREYAQKIQSEDLQKIWAKALAGEMKTPGSYSLRTLEFIKDLTQQEALQISKLAPFVFNGFIYRNEELDKNAINFEFLLEMEDFGILSGVKGGGLKITLNSASKDKYETAIMNKTIAIIIKNADANKILSLNCYKVTRIGKELFSLGEFSNNNDYIDCICKSIISQGYEVQKIKLD